MKLQEVIDVLNSVMEERQNETLALEKVREFAKAQGFTLEQLGYRLNAENVLESTHTQDIVPAADNKRPVKPKFKTINSAMFVRKQTGGIISVGQKHTIHSTGILFQCKKWVGYFFYFKGRGSR